MDAYIKRADALEAIRKWCGDCGSAIEAVLSVPAAHGRWRESGPLLECQSCGEIYSRLGGNAGKLWNYCPNCGAKMDGDSDES